MEGETSKTYYFGQDNNLLSTLVPLLTQHGIDPSILALLNNNGMGGNGAWFIWILFLVILMGRGGNWFGNGGNGTIDNAYLANQMNNTTGRDLLLQATQGNANAISQLATNMGIATNRISDAVTSLGTMIQSVGSQVGLTACQTQNAIQMGDAALSRQLCECCCENRLLTTQQGYEAQLRTVEQTNQLGSQADRNFNALSNEIAGLKASMVDQFCQIERRELQNKIDTQGDIITQLRGQLDNDRQTAQLYNAISPIQAKVNEIANKQPNTVPVQWPNLTAVNNTPYVGGYSYGFNPYGYGWGGQSYWG